MRFWDQQNQSSCTSHPHLTAMTWRIYDRRQVAKFVTYVTDLISKFSG